MAVKTNVFVEVNADQYNMTEVMDKAMAACKKECKGAIKNLNVYVKPEDGKAYYVANDDTITGSVDL